MNASEEENRRREAICALHGWTYRRESDHLLPNVHTADGRNVMHVSSDGAWVAMLPNHWYDEGGTFDEAITKALDQLVPD